MTAPYYEDDQGTVWHGDCLDVLREMPDASVDAVVTDPPYGLGFMGAKWDTYANEIGRAKSSKHKFDHVGGNHNPSNSADSARTRRVESQRFGDWCEDWTAECLRVLKPGGHMLAFGGTRTWHRLACAVEDAGFEVRDSIAWLYGSGFPKSLDVSKAIDKAGGNPLAFRAFARAYAAAVASSPLTHSDVDRRLGIKSSSCYWARDDHRGGMPPRHHWEAARDLLGLDAEFERLYDEAERADREVRAGQASGSLSSASVRVLNAGTPATPAAQQWQGWGTALKPAFEPIVVARKPLVGTVAANVLAHGTGALNIDVTRVGSGGQLKWEKPRDMGYHGGTDSGPVSATENTAGRWPTNVVLDGDAAAELDEQSGTLKSGALDRSKITAANGIYGAAPAERTGTYEPGSGGASRFFPAFRYQAKAPTRERVKVGDVAHPTVKPLALMRWLVRLVTPPGGVVLDPFAGSGTTIEAAILEGFQVIGIEREADYLPLIEARIARSRITDDGLPEASDALALFDIEEPA